MKQAQNPCWWLLPVVLLALPALAQDPAVGDASMRDVLELEDETARLLEERAAEIPASSEEAYTPLAALLGLDEAYRAGDIAASTEYLDMRYLPPDLDGWTPEQLVQAITIVWDQQNVLDITAVSDEPEGNLDDGLPSYRDQLGSVLLEDEVVPIYLQRVPNAAGEQVWKISNATIARVPDMWDEWGYNPVALYFRDVLPQFSFLGMENWQLLFTVIFFVLAWPVSMLLSNLLMNIAMRIPNGFPSGIRRFFQVPMRFFLFLLLARVLIDQLSLSVTARAILQSSGINYIAVIVLVMGLLSLMRDYQIRKLERDGSPQYAALLRPMTTIVKVLFLIATGLIWADAAGYNMTTILAGLGVGSLAVALAAQKTLENLIGAITLYAAQPVKAGDFCRFGTTVGTVEEIGLRSTSVRTLNRTLVTIPNAVFAASEVENYTARDRIRYFRYIRLQLGTPGQLRAVLAAIREMLEAHPQVQQDTVSVRFEKLEDLSALLRIDGGVMTQDFQEYLAVAEDLNLRILDAVEEAGLYLCGPGQTVVLQQPDEVSHQIAK